MAASGDPRAYRAAQGLIASAVGMILALLGLTWDGLLHAHDATLAGHEMLQSFANPGHPLLLVGMGVSVLASALYLLSTRRPSSLAGAAALLAGVVLQLWGTLSDMLEHSGEVVEHAVGEHHDANPFGLGDQTHLLLASGLGLGTLGLLVLLDERYGSFHHQSTLRNALLVVASVCFGAISTLSLAG